MRIIYLKISISTIYRTFNVDTVVYSRILNIDFKYRRKVGQFLRNLLYQQNLTALNEN